MPRRHFSSSQTQRHRQQVLEQLQIAFEGFRQRSRPRARILPELRVAALEALGSGVAPDRICRACGVARKQLDRWRQLADEAKSGESRGASPAPAPKVLSVVRDEVVGPAPVAPSAVREQSGSADLGGDIELDVRLGSWGLSVRLTPIASREC